LHFEFCILNLLMKSLTLSAFDVGSYSIKGLVAKKNLSSGDIQILAQAEVACSGMRNGEVARPERVAESLLAAKEELSKKANLKIREAMFNINGKHLFSVASQGLVSVSRADQKISYEDVQRVLRAAQAIHLPSNKEVLDVLPQEYIIDNDGSVKDPLGLKGIRLEVRALLLGIFSPVLENLEKACSLTNLGILGGPIPSPLAAARSVLSQEHKELGCLVIDLGATTTSVSVFEQGDLKDLALFPIGSANITNDIAICLRTEIATAEVIKKKYGTLKSVAINKILNKKQKIKQPLRNQEENPLEEILDEEQEVLPSFSPKLLKNIVEDRFNQLFFEIQKALKRISAQPLPAGVFFTGGGSAMPGLVELAKQKLKLPCRLGYPRGVIGCDDPKSATCLGLLLLGFDDLEEEREMPSSGGFQDKLKRFFRIFLP
jgi:cell division protein FtsA